MTKKPYANPHLPAAIGSPAFLRALRNPVNLTRAVSTAQTVKCPVVLIADCDARARQVDTYAERFPNKLCIGVRSTPFSEGFPEPRPNTHLFVGDWQSALRKLAPRTPGFGPLHQMIVPELPASLPSDTLAAWRSLLCDMGELHFLAGEHAAVIALTAGARRVFAHPQESVRVLAGLNVTVPGIDPMLVAVDLTHAKPSLLQDLQEFSGAPPKRRLSLWELISDHLLPLDSEPQADMARFTSFSKANPFYWLGAKRLSAELAPPA